VDLYLSSKIIWSKEIPEVVELIGNYDYDGIELWYEHFLNQGYEDHSKKPGLINLLKENSLPLWIHGPIMDINTTSINPEIARVSIEENLQAIDLANRTNAKGIVIHPGLLSSSTDDPELYWQDQIKVTKRLVREANCLVAIENMDSDRYHFVQQPSDFSRLLNNIDSSNVGICFDVAHARSLENIGEFLEEASTKINHIHYSNSSDESIHKPIDRGDSNLTEEFLDYLEGFDGVLTFEGRDPEREIEIARKTREIFLKKTEDIRLE